ncbi:peptidase M20, partial [Escherichia coli]
LEAAVRFLKNVYDFDRQLPAEWNHLMKFGQIQGGTIRNVLAGEVIVSGSIRSYSSDMQNYLKRGLAHLAEQFHSAATISFRYNDGYPAVINHGGLYAALSDSNKLHELEDPVLQAEDFGIYTQQYP